MFVYWLILKSKLEYKSDLFKTVTSLKGKKKNSEGEILKKMDMSFA